MSSSTWQEFFKDRLLGLEPPRDGSFLEAALSEKRFSEDEYLKWASRHLLLPLLDGRFFTEHDADATLLKRAPLKWTSCLLPVHEWDGVLIVAGLEKPDDLPSGAVFVLAAPSDMTHWWETLAPQTTAGSPIETPEGITDEKPQLQGLSFAGVSLKPAEQAPVVPDGETSISLSITEPELETTLVRASEASIQSTEAADPTSLTQTGLLAAEIPATPAAPAAEFSVFTNPANEPHVLSDFSVDHKTFVQDVTDALRAMSEQFPKTMFLAANEQNTVLIPQIWSHAFGMPQTAGRIPLNAPSPFRLAFLTEKPYHGFVVPNDVTEMFSKVWNGGKTPDHLTIVPVFYLNRVVGTLIGVGPSTCSSLPVLRTVEKISADLTQKFGGAIEDSAA